MEMLIKEQSKIWQLSNQCFPRKIIWLTQKSMAELFGVGVSAIYKHLKNIFTEGELKEEATISKMEIVQMEGARD